MKKILSILLTVTMVFSLVAAFRAPTAKAAVTWTYGFNVDVAEHGEAYWTMAEAHSGTWSVAMKVPNPTTDKAEIVFTPSSTIKLSEIDPAQLSFYTKSLNAHTPYIIIDLTDGVNQVFINTDMATQITNDWQPYVASPTSQWQLSDGGWYYWSAILSALGNMTVEDIIIEGAEGSGDNNLAYVDLVKINNVTVLDDLIAATYNLTVNVTPASSGTVTPASGTYPAGTVVTLTAVPATGYSSVAWTNATSTGTFTATVTMTANTIVSATFSPTPPTGQPVTGLKSKDQYTWLPTYKFGEPIVGITTSASAQSVKLLKADGTTYVDIFVLPATGAGQTFVIPTGSVTTEDTYIVQQSSDTAFTSTNLIPGTAKVYIQKYNMPAPSTSATPDFDVTGVSIWGNLYDANTMQFTIGTDVYLKYSTDGSSWSLWSGTLINPVTTQLPNGFFLFNGVNFSQYGYYGLFTNNTSTGKPYYYWYLSPGALTVTKVIVEANSNEILLYGYGSNLPSSMYVQHAYIKVTDSDGAGVPLANITWNSGVGSLGCFVVNELGGGFYDLVFNVNSSSIGIGLMNIKVVYPSTEAQSTFSLRFIAYNINDINPFVVMNVPNAPNWGGLKIDEFVGFDVYYNAGSNYQIGIDPNGDPLQSTSFEDPVPLYVSSGFVDSTGVGSFAYTSTKGKIVQGGQIKIDAQAMLWTAGDNALTASTKEVKKVFIVNPAVSGDIITVSPASATVGDTADITVTVKTAAGVERNNARVTLTGPVGMFTYPAPVGANYTVSGDGTTAIIDASVVNQNIVGGNYIFNGLKFNLTTLPSGAYIDVKVEYLYVSSWHTTADLYHKIKVNPKSVTLTADVSHLVAGLPYPVIKVSGGVKGLTFTGLTADYDTFNPSYIDNGDGTYIFNLSAIPDTASITFTGTNASYYPDTKYVLKLDVVQPKLTFLSVHKDGLITDSFSEVVEFTLTDPDTGDYITPSYVSLAPEFAVWDVTGQLNLQVSADVESYDSGDANESVDGTVSLNSNTVKDPLTGTAWTTGNDNVDYTVYKPYVAVGVQINGQYIVFNNQLLVTSPSITFAVQGHDTLELYKGVENTITATALDAHTQPLKNAMVGIAGNIQTDWISINDYLLEAGGRTGSDGKVIFSFTPKYIGNYKLLLATSVGAILKKAYVPSVQAPADTTAPVVTITAPADAATVSTSTVTVTGSVTDNVGVTSVYLNDVTSVTLKPDGTFAQVLSLVEGENTIVIKAFDAAGNKTEKFVKVTYTKPVVKQTVVKIQIGSDIMIVNGNAVQIDAPAEIMNGRTFLPLRAISEALGATVDWIAETQGITVTLGNSTIGLQIGNTSAVVNGTVKTLDAAPYIKNGRTMVPFRVIAEGLGATVEWDPALRIVTVTLAQ
jgi:hypothetical protein